MCRLELVTLEKFPEQIGTEFYIVTLDYVNSCDMYIVVGDGTVKDLVEGSEFKLTDIDIRDGVAILAKPHAELRALYKETGGKFEDWEFEVIGDCWESMDRKPNWFSGTEYRYNPKPKTITINGVEVPAPETREPELGGVYYLVDTFEPIKGTWEDSGICKLWLRRGLVHKSRENAQKHLEALVRASSGEIDG